MISPMTKASTLHDYARIGAAARIKELQEEIARIRRDVPGLATPAPERRGPGRPKARPTTAPSPSAEAPEEAAPVKRKRRKMSAAARKAISDAQKKRWAAQKKAEKARA
jgi:hypothetical protein